MSDKDNLGLEWEGEGVLDGKSFVHHVSFRRFWFMFQSRGVTLFWNQVVTLISKSGYEFDNYQCRSKIIVSSGARYSHK